MTIRDSNYITILAPMITRLKLKGNELLVFALIHGFSQDGESRFKGSLRYLIEWTGLDKTTVIKILKSLVEKQYINKFEYEKNKVRFCEYSTNYWAALEWLENPTPPVGKSNPILNTNIDSSFNIDNDKPANVVVGDLFPDEKVEKLRGTTERTKCLFANSRFYDFEKFEKCFSAAEYEKIDIWHYYTVVRDWSASKGRMQKDWIAQTRNIMRSANEKGQLKLKPEYQAPQQKLNIGGAMDFLKDYD